VIRTATAADLLAVVALWDLAGGPARTPHSLVNAERPFRLDAMVNDADEGARAFWASAGFSLEDHDSRWSRLVPPVG
jgi:hypothetical protein